MYVPESEYPGINKITFFDCMRSLKYDMKLSGKWWNAIDCTLRSYHRHYRTHSKLYDMLTDLNWATSHDIGISAENFDFLSLVMFFTDVGYDPENVNWEIDSARTWTEFAECVSMPVEHRLYGYELLVGLTSLVAFDLLSLLFYDAELVVYSDSQRDYDMFCTRVRAEYKHLGEDEWRKYRIKELNYLLDRPSFYANTMVSDIMSDMAEENVKRELARLTKPALTVVA
jgi:predicted metal-dependent HD superfamily phosphohydrolase